LHRTFHVPPRFHPAYSLLGRALRRLTGDARHAEALFLVTLSTGVLGLLLIHFLAWTKVQPAIEADPTGPTGLVFWLSQLGGLLACVLVGILGFAPAIDLTVTATALILRQGTRECTLPYTEILSVTAISALHYHRHYACYAATQAFVNRLTPQVLLLQTADGPVVLGLLGDDHATVQAHLEKRLLHAGTPTIARVA